jgi:hypothetical protein
MSRQYNRPILFALASVLIVASCALGSAVRGIPATDLSGLHKGMRQVDAEKLLGEPKDVTKTESGYTARYTYDRGYAPPRDPDGGIDPGLFFTTVLGEIGTLGLSPRCATECQKGELAASYGMSGALVSVTESAGPGGGRCERGQSAGYCSHVRDNPQPSTLAQPLR